MKSEYEPHFYPAPGVRAPFVGAQTVVILDEVDNALVAAIQTWADKRMNERGRLPEWLEIMTSSGIVRLETRR